ncbi:MAG: ribonuclease E activity regulator RraA [Alphaproteobacteria bacterium]|nr:ribonuclease E activity regulator RraA [Alphaproteobacteria bacterium]
MTPTTDLCDAHGAKLQVCAPLWRDFGGLDSFSGPIETVRTHDDNTKVRATLETPGGGRVLVVDNGGSQACAVVGGNLGKLAEANGWAGIVVNGYVRDAAELATCKTGIKALGPYPRKSLKADRGVVGEVVGFWGVTFAPGHFLYADRDGIVVSETRLG